MMFAQVVSPVSVNDVDLVQQSLAGSSQAFAEIVARYQTLICSLTYNATGSLSRSEDLAQDVFVTAWKELRQLREAEKLRPWLCGIARRLAANSLRREVREPVFKATELSDEHHAPGLGPSEQAISHEEESILWKTLAQIPESYREPLILFYREGQSVERVAAALDLSEETARQRLSRGRKYLQEQVALTVEGVLKKSTPKRAFTLGVIATLPLLGTSASAATLGTAAAKGSAASFGVGSWGALGFLLGPLVGCFGAWFGVKASLDAAESESEKRLIRRQTAWVLALVAAFLLAMLVGMPLALKYSSAHPTVAIAGIIALPLLYAAALLTMILRFNRAQSRLRAEHDAALPEAASGRAESWQTFEYRSRWTFLGLPLVHVRTGRPRGQKLAPALGWIAVGDVAVGVLVSVGGIAFGGLSLGGVSLGLAAFGGVAFGGISFGGLAVGLWAAVGGMAVGYLAHGGAALAWHAAQGGLAVAHDFAVGGSAHAAHANDALARSAVSSTRFFRWANALMLQPGWTYLAWGPIVLIPWQVIRARRARQSRTAGR